MDRLVKGFHDLEYYDEELWHKLAEAVSRKNIINNIYYYDNFYKIFNELNNDPSKPFFKKFDSVVALLAVKHYTKDREWRYTHEDGGRFRTLRELIARREEP